MDYTPFLQFINYPLVYDLFSAVTANTINSILERLAREKMQDSPEYQTIEVIGKAFEYVKKRYGLNYECGNIDLSVLRDFNRPTADRMKDLLSAVTGLEKEKIGDEVLNYWIASFYRELSNPKYQWGLNFVNMMGMTFVENTTAIMNAKIGSGNYQIPLSSKQIPQCDISFDECEDYQAVFRKAIIAFRGITKTDYNQVILFTKIDSHSSGLIVYADDIPVGKQRYRKVIQSGLIYKSYVEQKDIIQNYKYHNPHYFEAVPQTESEMVIPIENAGKILGVLNTESELRDAYPDDISEKISGLAKALGSALVSKGFTQACLPSELPYVHLDESGFLEITHR